MRGRAPAPRPDRSVDRGPPRTEGLRGPRARGTLWHAWTQVYAGVRHPSGQRSEVHGERSGRPSWRRISRRAPLAGRAARVRPKTRASSSRALRDAPPPGRSEAGSLNGRSRSVESRHLDGLAEPEAVQAALERVAVADDG